MRELLRRRPRAGARLHRAARRPVRPPSRRARGGAEDRGRPAQPLPTLEAALADGRFEAQSRGAAALPANRNARRLRPSPSPAGPSTNLGGGVTARRQLGSRATRRPARGAHVEVVSHPDLARLHPTGPYPESPARLAVLLRNLGSWREASPAADADVERCHDRDYIAQIRAISGPTLLDLDTACSETTYPAALLSAGAAITAAEIGGFAVARPPGHHALRDRAMGFCFFNNVAIAGRWAQAELGLERVAIVDWDVHHGNGTQAIFWDDPSVLYVSIHQWPLYPGTGGPVEQDETTVNVPLPRGSGDAEYMRAWEEQVEPAVRRFEPELLLVSAGFDAHSDDPLVGDGGVGGRLPRAGAKVSLPRSARRRSARGRLQPRDAAEARGGCAGRLKMGCLLEDHRTRRANSSALLNAERPARKPAAGALAGPPRFVPRPVRLAARTRFVLAVSSPVARASIACSVTVLGEPGSPTVGDTRTPSASRPLGAPRRGAPRREPRAPRGARRRSAFAAGSSRASALCARR